MSQGSEGLLFFCRWVYFVAGFPSHHPEFEVSTPSEIHVFLHGLPLTLTLCILCLFGCSFCIQKCSKPESSVDHLREGYTAHKVQGTFQQRAPSPSGPALPMPSSYVSFPYSDLCQIWGFCEFLISPLQNEKQGR